MDIEKEDKKNEKVTKGKLKIGLKKKSMLDNDSDGSDISINDDAELIKRKKDIKVIKIKVKEPVISSSINSNLTLSLSKMKKEDEDKKDKSEVISNHKENGISLKLPKKKSVLDKNDILWLSFGFYKSGELIKIPNLRGLSSITQENRLATYISECIRYLSEIIGDFKVNYFLYFHLLSIIIFYFFLNRIFLLVY